MTKMTNEATTKKYRLFILSTEYEEYLGVVEIEDLQRDLPKMLQAASKTGYEVADTFYWDAYELPDELSGVDPEEYEALRDGDAEYIVHEGDLDLEALVSLKLNVAKIHVSDENYIWVTGYPKYGHPTLLEHAIRFDELDLEPTHEPTPEPEPETLAEEAEEVEEGLLPEDVNICPTERIYVVLYHHRHGVDAWPVIGLPDMELIEEEMERLGDYEPDREDEYFDYVGGFSLKDLFGSKKAKEKAKDED